MRKRASPYLGRACLVLALGFGCLMAAASGLTDFLDNRLAALRFQVRERAPTGTIVLVDIDAKSLAEIGVWPWPRTLHGELVEAASRLGATRIAFDVDFSASSTPEADASFADSLSRSGGAETFLAAFVQEQTVGGGRLVPSMPIELLLQQSWPAIVNVPVDSDGRVRSFPFAVKTGDETLASLPSVLSGAERLEGEFGIDFSIAAAGIARFSFVDVLNERVAPQAIAGKTLIVGATALELRDLFSVPVGGVISGSTILALATETLLQGRELEHLEMPVLLLIALALFAMAGLGRIGSKRVLIGVGAVSLAAEALALYLQVSHGVVLATASTHVVSAGLAVWAVTREFDLRRLLLWVARTETRNGRNMLERVIEDGFDGIVILNGQDRIIRINRLAGELLAVDGAACLDDLPHGIGDNVRNGRRIFAGGSVSWRQPLQQTLIDSDGVQRILEYTVAPFGLEAISDDDEEIDDAVFVCLSIRDVTERQLAQDNMRFLALHDTLTGLHNRRALEQRLSEMPMAASRSGGLTLLYFDLDRFKAVNDSLGHAIGDKVLVETARRAREALGETAYVARVGGDEFSALLPAGSPQVAEAKASALVAAIGKPFELAGHRISIDTCVGVGWWAEPGETASGMMRQADAALYCAKRAGGNQVVLFESWMEKDRLARLEMENDLVTAFENGEFQVVYQPQIALKSGEVMGAEALLRWRHPTKGLISPTLFIPVAEEMGLIHRLGAWVLSTACSDAMGWPDPIRIAVNISSIQFETGDLVAAVKQATQASGLPGGRLELEITESAFVKESDRLKGIFDRLLAMGITFALDDFGTGYSSLGYLHRFPIAQIKIDQSFVTGIPGDGHAMAIIRSIKALAEGLGIRTIAEGIETAEQAEILRILGCDDGQGHLFSRPVDSDAIARLLDHKSGDNRLTELAVA